MLYYILNTITITITLKNLNSHSIFFSVEHQTKQYQLFSCNKSDNESIIKMY